jgi:hypothetical protein
MGAEATAKELPPTWAREDALELTLLIARVR